MAEVILFVFEGEKTEVQLSDSLLPHFIADGENTIVRTAYRNHIYSLYRDMESDGFIDIVELLKEDNESLRDFSRDSFSQVYLFFDYDGHVPDPGKDRDNQVRLLINFFNEETEQGKLFVSYPMVEAINCISDLDAEHEIMGMAVKIEKFKAFKTFVSGMSDKRIKVYSDMTRTEWNKLIRLHCSKANLIVNGVVDFPDVDNVSQSKIFDSQLMKHILPSGEASVLSGFPLMLLDYYGREWLFDATS